VFVRSVTDGTERDLGAYLAACAPNQFGDRLDWGHQRTIVRALEELGIRPIQRQFVAGQWRLAELLEDAGVYQEYEGVHTKIEGSRRRVGVYPWPPTGPDTGRRARRKAANREFRLLGRVPLSGNLSADCPKVPTPDVRKSLRFSVYPMP